MRVFLTISKQGDSWPLAQRIQEEGHRALVYINESKTRLVGNGLVEKHPCQRELVDKNGKIDEGVLKEVLYPKPDCIVFDMVFKGSGKLADRLRKMGYPVIGNSAFGEQLELNRTYGNKIMKTMGINTPKTYTFKDTKEAIKFVEDIGKPFVYKPLGNKPTMTTYIAERVEDLIAMLEYHSDINEDFELQEKVEGIEISTEVFFNGKDIVNVNHTMEEKTLMDNGTGPLTGSMGSVVWEGRQESRIFKEGVGKVIPALKKTSYRGPIDINTIITKNKLYGLEWSCRFGYDAIFVLMELYRSRINDLLYAIATGVARPIKLREGCGIGVVFCVEPYPLPVSEDYSKDIPIFGINKQNSKHIWLYDAYRKNNFYACAGCGGNLGAVTAYGEPMGQYGAIREAKRRVYRTLSNLTIPTVMYRRTIGDRYSRETKQLQEWGWL